MRCPEPVEGRLLLFDLRVMADTFRVLAKGQGL